LLSVLRVTPLSVHCAEKLRETDGSTYFLETSTPCFCKSSSD
jgi:hypothetical protein